VTRPAAQAAPAARQPAILTGLRQIVFGFLIALFVTVFVVQGYQVSGACMEPHLSTGERVLADKLAYQLHQPKRGEIVIFAYPRDPRQMYVKRVIGMPEETISIKQGIVYIDNKPLPETYKTFAAHGDLAPTFIAHDEYFVMGDNRSNSKDSRDFGSVPMQDVVGKALQVWFSSGPGGVRWQRLGKMLE